MSTSYYVVTSCESRKGRVGETFRCLGIGESLDTARELYNDNVADPTVSLVLLVKSNSDSPDTILEAYESGLRNYSISAAARLTYNRRYAPPSMQLSAIQDACEAWRASASANGTTYPAPDVTAAKGKKGK